MRSAYLIAKDSLPHHTDDTTPIINLHAPQYLYSRACTKALWSFYCVSGCHLYCEASWCAQNLRQTLILADFLGCLNCAGPAWLDAASQEQPLATRGLSDHCQAHTRCFQVWPTLVIARGDFLLSCELQRAGLCSPVGKADFLACISEEI